MAIDVPQDLSSPSKVTTEYSKVDPSWINQGILATRLHKWWNLLTKSFSIQDSKSLIAWHIIQKVVHWFRFSPLNKTDHRHRESGKRERRVCWAKFYIVTKFHRKRPNSLALPRPGTLNLFSTRFLFGTFWNGLGQRIDFCLIFLTNGVVSKTPFLTMIMLLV